MFTPKKEAKLSFIHMKKNGSKEKVRQHEIRSLTYQAGTLKNRRQRILLGNCWGKCKLVYVFWREITHT